MGDSRYIIYPIYKKKRRLPTKKLQQLDVQRYINLNPGAISLYYIAAEYMSFFIRNLREMTSSERSSRTGFK